MNPGKQSFLGLLRTRKGFSLIELLVIIVVLGILAGMAIPAFVQWRRSVEYRAVTRNIASTLREARSRAISTNLQQCVTIQAANRRFQLTQCPQSANSQAVNCITVIQGWMTLPPNVNMTADVDAVMFSPNGSVSFESAAPPVTGTISIQDTTPITRFDVTVAQTGRVQIIRRN